MSETVSIPKNKSSFPDYLDFEKLRALGLEHIQKMGSNLWTDYNLHDPGITILEALCYAITDLGYRANFDIKDLLTLTLADKNKFEKNLLNQPADNNFFSAAEILGCNPVTLIDYRKLFLDIKGVKNVWFEKSLKQTKIYIDKQEKTLTYTYNTLPGGGGVDTGESTDTNSISESCNELILNGLYDIYVELDSQLIVDACGRTIISKEDTIEQVYKVFHQHRNLCEDVRDVIIYGEEEIALCTDIEISTDAIPENVMLDIFLKIEEFLCPSLRYYTLQEMLEKGKSIEEIFEGRPLSNYADNEDNCLSIIPSRGFIDVDELEKLDPQEVLHISDLHQVIMGVEGVIAVKNLAAVNYINGYANTRGEEWCLKLTSGYKQHITIEQSKINLYKGPYITSTNKTVIKQRFNEEKLTKTKTCLEPYQLDLSVPEGSYKDIADYTSILHDFPILYGIGIEGLREVPTPQRQAQAKQLKAYLLFFDQILANYLSQLSNLRNLFKVRFDVDDTTDEQTYFTQILKDIPGSEEIIKNFYGCSSYCNDGSIPDDYPGYLKYIAESAETFSDRKNRFLDHLLARFSESFTSYAALTFEYFQSDNYKEKILNDKRNFLSDYPEISRNRGKAFNILQKPGCRFEINKSESGWSFYILNSAGEKILYSTEFYVDKQSAYEGYEKVSPLLNNYSCYSKITYENKGEDSEKYPNLYGFSVLQKGKNSGVILAESCNRYKTSNELDIVLYNFISERTNISGYEKRVSHLLGIEDNGCYKLCNFEVKKIETGWIFYIQNSEKVNILKSAEIFADKQSSLTGYERLCSFLSSDANYRKMTYQNQGEDSAEYPQLYGFIVVELLIGQPSPVVLAESCSRYNSTNERDKVLYSFILSLQLKGAGSLIEQETECFEYQVFDSKGEDLIFKSFRGYKTPEITSGELSVLIETGSNINSYRDFETHKGFGFKIVKLPVKKAGNSDDEILAIHQIFYKTELERDYRKEVCVYYFDDDAPKPPKIGGTQGEFILNVQDTTGKCVLISPPEGSEIKYKTETQARRIYEKIRRRASDVSGKYYVLHNDIEGDKPYGFSIADKDGSILASHPDSYKTQEERDLAIHVVMFGIRNQAASYRIVEIESEFRFELLDMNNDLLMQSSKNYSDATSAEDGWKELLELACARSNYKTTTKLKDPAPYSFEIIGKDKKPLAFYIRSFVNEEQRDLALQAVINYLCFTEFKEEISGTTGTYNFQLISKYDKLLLESVLYYPDESSAKTAFYEMISLAKEYENYFPDNIGYGFEIRDSLNQPVARPPQSLLINNNDEREAVIAVIMTYLRNDEVITAIENIGGAFYSKISDSEGNQLLQGTILSPSMKLATTEIDKLLGTDSILGFASNPDNYFSHLDGKGNCIHGFYIRDKEQNILAKSPKNYPGIESCNKAELNALAHLSDWKKLKQDFVASHNYRILTDYNNKQLLDIDEPWLLSKGIADFSLFARDKKNYTAVNEGEYYVLTLMDSETFVARHNEYFSSQAEALKYADLVIGFLELNGNKFNVNYDTQQKKYFFTIDMPGGEGSFKGNYFASEQKAKDELKKALVLAQSVNYYDKEPINSKENSETLEGEDTNNQTQTQEYRIVLKNASGIIVAIFDQKYNSEQECIEKFPELVSCFSKDYIPERINNTKTKYYYELRGFGNEVYLTGINLIEFNSASDALKDEFYNKYLGLALDKSNYKIVLSYQKQIGANPQCYYSFYIADNSSNEVKILVHPQKYLCKSVCSNIIQFILNWLNVLFVNQQIEGICCGYKFSFTFPLNSDEAKQEDEDKGKKRAKTEKKNSEKQEITIQSALHYPSEGWAYMAATETAALLNNSMNYFLSEHHGHRKHWLIKNKYNQHLATIHLKDADNQEEIRDTIINHFSSSVVNINFVQEETEPFYCSILKQNEQILLKSVPVIIQAGEDESSEDSSFAKAWEYCDIISEKAQFDSNYLEIRAEDDCLFGFELLGKCYALVASHNQYYSNTTSVDEIKTKIKKLLGTEGMHLVEHILLRPINRGLQQIYNFIVNNSSASSVSNKNQKKGKKSVENKNENYSSLLNGIIPDISSSEITNFSSIEKIARLFFDYIIKTNREPKLEWISDNNNTQNYSFVWKVENAEGTQITIAISENTYCEKNDESDDFALVLEKLQRLYDELIELPWNYENKSEIIEILSPFIISKYTEQELTGDKFLPLPALCSSANISCEQADPYSFRMTLVLPYWTGRFINREFREFINETFQFEAPAHILLRTCWVNNYQMYLFEKAYQRWLESLSLDKRHCDSTKARNELIDILTCLRSNYPETHLFSCEQDETDNNAVILDYSKLG